jgi:ureidoacrylate peracid hydrolase
MGDTSENPTLTPMLPARPESIPIDISKTAVLVVDMQNDFGSKGGMFDRSGIDISGIRRVITPISKVLHSARSVGMRVVYIKMAFRPDLSDLGTPGSPNRERHLLYGVGQTVPTPDGKEGRTLIRDTWNTDIIQELAPQPGDTVVYKHRYSAFFQTELDSILTQLGVRQLIVTGCTTSVCVESTLRDAFFRDYSCILLEDCTAEPIGSAAAGYQLGSATQPPSGGSNHDATLVLVQLLFGWISDSQAVIHALQNETVTARST